MRTRAIVAMLLVAALLAGAACITLPKRPDPYVNCVRVIAGGGALDFAECYYLIAENGILVVKFRDGSKVSIRDWNAVFEISCDKAGSPQEPTAPGRYGPYRPGTPLPVYSEQPTK